MDTFAFERKNHVPLGMCPPDEVRRDKARAHIRLHALWILCQRSGC